MRSTSHTDDHTKNDTQNTTIRTDSVRIRKFEKSANSKHLADTGQNPKHTRDKE